MGQVMTRSSPSKMVHVPSGSLALSLVQLGTLLLKGQSRFARYRVARSEWLSNGNPNTSANGWGGVRLFGSGSRFRDFLRHASDCSKVRRQRQRGKETKKARSKSDRDQPLVRRRTVAITRCRGTTIWQSDRGSGTRVHWYARHGRELVGCKSPVRKRELIGGQYTKCNRSSEVLGEGNCGEVTDRGEEACESLDRRSNRQRSSPKLRGYEQKRHRGLERS